MVVIAVGVVVTGVVVVGVATIHLYAATPAPLGEFAGSRRTEIGRRVAGGQGAAVALLGIEGARDRHGDRLERHGDRAVENGRELRQSLGGRQSECGYHQREAGVHYRGIERRQQLQTVECCMRLVWTPRTLR